MFIGDRKTKRSIRALRSPGEAVIIPKGMILRDVRTHTNGEPLRTTLISMAKSNPGMYLFEFRGETLCFVHRLLDVTTAR